MSPAPGNNVRQLPERVNPLLEEDRAPSHDVLVERRCLGQTELRVKQGQVGTSNATKPDNLGLLDYVHLRVPLPKDLSNSGIFLKSEKAKKFPESYFLMRRSSDGYVSATGMFKAAFPWAQQAEEAAEKEYIKSLATTAREEVAGNNWIHPDQALTLSDEYGIRLWIAALLDPQPIDHGGSESAKAIKSPPTYRFREAPNGMGRSPAGKKPDGKRSTRGTRHMRSESPTKKTPARKIATPRKTRGRARNPDSIAEQEETGSVIAESVNGEAPETVKVEIETVRKPTFDDGKEVEDTKLRIEMPMGHPGLEMPDDAEAMLAKAREMVAEANRIAGPSSGKGKRKAEEMGEDDGEDEDRLAGPVAKRARTAQLRYELRRETIKRRAFMTVAATMAFAAFIPSITTVFGL